MNSRTAHSWRRNISALLAVVAACASTPAAAQLVDPEDPPEDPARTDPSVEWRFGVRGVTSVSGTLQEDLGTSASFDVSDSLVFVRPRAPLTFLPDLRGGALFGLTFPDAYEQPGALLVADANVFLEHRWFVFRLGRGRIKSHIIPTPALRDDDLLRFAETQNPFSRGESTADHQYGNVADVSLWPTPTVSVDVHLENLSSGVLAPEALAAFEPNSLGVTVGYRAIPAQTTLSVIRQLGIGANAYRLDLPEAPFAFDAVAGSWLNLLVDPVHTVDWRAQVSWAVGVPGADPTTPTGSFRAASVSSFTSVGYTYRRSLLPTVRANVAGGYRRYLEGGADQLSVLGNVFYALGQNVDVGLQYQYRLADAALPRIFGEEQSHTFKIILIGTFEALLNPLFDDRASPLNTDNGYLP